MKESLTDACVIEVNDFVLTVAEYGTPYNLYDLDEKFNIKGFSVGNVVSFTCREELLSNGNRTKHILHIEKKNRA